MSWLGKSFGNLKDQISTLTREVLAEADEDSEGKFSNMNVIFYY